MNLAVVVLSAGKGTRMKSSLPKCMHEVAHRPMVLLAIDRARQLNPERIICVVGGDQPQLKQAVEQEGIQTVIQEDRLGTAHAVLQAYEELKDFQGIILVTYGDTPMVRPSSLAYLTDSLAADSQALISILGFYTDDPGSYGRIVFNEHGEFVRIVEAKDASPMELSIDFVNSGFMALKSPLCWNILKDIKNDNSAGEYYLTESVTIANIRGYKSIAVEGSGPELRGVNDCMELAQTEAIKQYRLRKNHMLNGVRLLAPETVYFAYDTEIGANVTIEPNVFFGPNVKIGEGTHIKAFSHIENTTIGENCNIGPFARLRPETHINDYVNIGNFVEVKKSEINKGSKVNHLSYIGDSYIGERTNVGAGTITCNYDGFFKYKTHIDDDVFVGSNSLLIAPVTVNAGSTIAAGTVVTKDVPEGSLTITRPEQNHVEGWSKEFREKMKAKKEEAQEKPHLILKS